MNENLNYQNAEPIILGSGELYIMKSSDIVNPAKLTPEEEAKLQNIGAIDSGASVTIAKDYEDLKSANRGVITRLLKSTTVTFKTGIITFIMENMAKFLYGVDYVKDIATKTNKMVIGDESAPVVYLRFIHTDKATGKQLIVNMYRAMFGGEQELNFDTEKPVAINYEFNGLTTDINKKQCYVEFIEYDPNMVVKEGK